MNNVIHVDFKKKNEPPDCECEVCSGESDFTQYVQNRRSEYSTLGWSLAVLVILVGIATLVSF